MKIKENLEILGIPARDRITGFKGVISSVSFDLYGCIQCVITPTVDKNGQMREGRWFDIIRVEKLNSKPVMQRPNFDFGEVADGKKGPAEKPMFYKT